MSEMFREILVSEDDILKDAIQKAKSFIGIEQGSGNIILRVPRGQIGARELIALYLIGRYFAHKMKMKTADSSSLSTKDIATLSGIDYGTVASRLAELVNAGWIKRVTRGEFEINSPVLGSFLDEIVSSQSKRTAPNLNGVTLPPSSVPQIRPSRKRNGGGLTSSVLEAFATDWGKTGRDWKEIKQELKRNGASFSDGSLTGTLTLLTQSHRVRRIKDGRSYRYTLA